MNTNAELNVIAALDLVPIKVKLMHKESGEGWSLAQANEVEIEYRRFLFLLKQFPHEPVVPRFDVDIFWHYHILDTMKYAIDCEQIFGHFLHHYPYGGLGAEDDQAAHHRNGARTQELYEATFGIAIRHEQHDDGASQTQPILANLAWCNGVMVPPALHPSLLSNPAWCNGAMVQPGSPPPAPTNNAWCNGFAQSNSPHAPVANTASCNGVMAQAGASRSPSSNTAWCNGLARSTASPARFTEMAWCNGIMATTALSDWGTSNNAWEPAATAWCNGLTATPRLQGGRSTTTRPQGVARNDSVYSQQEFAFVA